MTAIIEKKVGEKRDKLSTEVATHEEHMAVCLPTYNTFMKEEEGRNNALKSAVYPS